jgi:hypothetical protein
VLFWRLSLPEDPLFFMSAELGALIWKVQFLLSSYQRINCALISFVVACTWASDVLWMADYGA